MLTLAPSFVFPFFLQRLVGFIYNVSGTHSDYTTNVLRLRALTLVKIEENDDTVFLL